MNIFRSLDISASALTAQRFRMDIAGENIANQSTTRTANGGPYRRKYVVFEERQQPYLFKQFLQVSQERTGGAGVHVTKVGEDQSPFKIVYDPQHPDADAEGYVRLPNVDVVREMVDMMAATRSYEANITAIDNFKNMAMKALEIGR